jgi:hypothetical protein
MDIISKERTRSDIWNSIAAQIPSASFIGVARSPSFYSSRAFGAMLTAHAIDRPGISKTTALQPAL